MRFKTYLFTLQATLDKPTIAPFYLSKATNSIELVEVVQCVQYKIRVAMNNTHKTALCIVTFLLIA